MILAQPVRVGSSVIAHNMDSHNMVTPGVAAINTPMSNAWASSLSLDTWCHYLRGVGTVTAVFP